MAELLSGSGAFWLTMAGGGVVLILVFMAGRASVRSTQVTEGK